MGGKGADSGVTSGRVLVPAGRGIYAHTVVAVDSDTNGPIVLEADTGPISGDRMIGTFSKSGNGPADRQGRVGRASRHIARGERPGDCARFDGDGGREQHRRALRKAVPSAGGVGLHVGPRAGRGVGQFDDFGEPVRRHDVDHRTLDLQAGSVGGGGRVGDGGQHCAERGDPEGADRASRRQCLGWRGVPVEPLGQVARRFA